ncbi:MAG: NUDIX domain-containing protein [Pseudomonadota bacterium]
MPDKFEIVERQVGFHGFFQLDRLCLRHELFDGGWSEPLKREVLLRGLAVAVLPYDPRRDRVALIEQFRVGSAAAGKPPWLVEIPAGIVEANETAEGVARREALEEAGLELREIVPIVEFMPSPGGSSEVVQIVAGRIDRETVDGLFGLADEGEDIRALYLSSEDAFDLIGSERLTASFTIIALQWLILNKERLRREWLG